MNAIVDPSYTTTHVHMHVHITTTYTLYMQQLHVHVHVVTLNSTKATGGPPLENILAFVNPWQLQESRTAKSKLDYEG